MDPENMEHLRAGSVCVLLTADIATIERRLARAPRPPLTSPFLRISEIAEVIARRRHNYAAAADFCVDTSRTINEEAADRILGLLEKGRSLPRSGRQQQQWFAATPLPAPEREQLAVPAHRSRTASADPFLGVAGWPVRPQQEPAALQPALREIPA